MRYNELIGQGLRSPASLDKESKSEYEALLRKVIAREDHPERITKVLAEARAAGEPGLLNQPVIRYMTEEARARSFADQFGVVTSEGAPNQVPYMVFLEPDKVDVYDIALHGKSQNRVRKTQLFTTTDTYTSTGWKEITTPNVEYDGDNPFYPDKAAILETQAMDMAAYHLQRKLDTIAWDTLTLGIASFSGLKIWTFKDTDVQDLPTTNNITGGSAKSFWRNLRDHVFPYFDNQDKGNVVIDIHVRANDLQYLYQAAPVGTSLGAYTTFQERVFAAEQNMVIYGHQVRVHAENNRIASGYGYARVGPIFKMWLPIAGAVQNVMPTTPGFVAFRLRAWYSVLQPSVWNSNVCKFQWSTSDTGG